MDEINELLGYRIIEQLYVGSRTLVYRGVRESDRTPVVIKVLRNPYPSFSELLQFRNQYTIAKNLDQPSIVKTLTLEPYQNAYALVMEDFGGISLNEILKQEGNMGNTPQTLTTFIQIAIQIADALNELYRYRVIHKDLKPANIVIHPDSKQVKLIDFSIASLLPRETQEIQNANTLEGTLAYLSPEQTGRMNRGIDYRSDFYALGVTFYELLAGQLPFVSNDPMELVHCHLAKQPVKVDRLNSNIPSVLSEIISKLMAKNAEDRYQSALGLKYDLEICLDQLHKTDTIALFDLGTRDICDRFLIPEKLYGRETEVKALLNAFDHVSTGNTEMMLVAGFSGIGKTAVVNEVHKPIVRQRGYFIKGKYDQFQRNIPFSAFVQAFRDLMGQLLAESDTQLHNWKTQILQVVGDNGQVLIDVIPELEHIIGKQLPAPELSGSAAQNRFNLLMQKFVQVFTSVEHPLVLFLDDLQWADSGSLKLMGLLMQDTRHLLVIGAYRDNEVSPVHPLMLTVDEIFKIGATVHTITLQALSLVDINQLVADTLNCGIILAQPLTELVYKKTKGNPFFATQFLKSLHEDGQITFDWDMRHWQCDIAQIKALAITDDVVEFMALQLLKLPTQTQDVLRLAACIGAEFDLNTLAIVSEQSPEDAAVALWRALQEGLIIPTTEIYKFFTQSDTASQLNAVINPIYRFLHDRVQQAAYSLIVAAQKQVTHLQIGQRLLNHTSATQQEEKLFDIVNHLNQGVELITQSPERDRVIQLNLRAGQKAKLATAYAAAIDYFNTGITLLPIASWDSQYAQTLALYENAAEVSYLNGDFEQMQQRIDRVLKHAQTLLDRVKVYETQIQAAIVKKQFLQALEITLAVLEKLGVKLPKQPSQADVGQALQTTAGKLSQHSIADLVDLRLMNDPTALVIVRLIVKSLSAAYLAKPEVLPLLVCTGIDSFLKSGNSPLSAAIYSWYAVILCGIIGDIETGSQMGELTLNLLEKFPSREIEARAAFTVYYFVKPWKTHTNKTLDSLLESYQTGLENGDNEYAAWSAYCHCCYSYFVGENLAVLEPKFKLYCEAVTKIQQDAALNYFNIFRQSILNLLGFSEDICQLEGEAYSEAEMLPIQLAANDLTGLFFLYISKVILCCLFENQDLALKNLKLATQYMQGGISSQSIPLLFFYDSLVCLAIAPNSQDTELEARLARVAANQEKLQNWAQFAPMNHLHKWHLVEAERDRCLNNKIEAIDHYDRAIQLAKQNEYLNEEALANELTAKFYLEWGKEKVAQAYMIEAYYCYARWGAKAKIDDLEQRYRQLLAPVLERSHSPLRLNETISAKRTLTRTSSDRSSTSSISAAFDLGGILKASQALSGEIELEKLLSSLLQVAIENAGANKCALLLLENGVLVIKALAESKQSATVLCHTPLAESQDVSASLIYSVKRTFKPAIISNAIAIPTLAADPYIVRQQPKSLLCMPILNQGKLLGILYLENNLTFGAFTDDRVEVLNLLCAQAAISLENARLYQQAQQSLQDLQQAQMQIVQSEKMSALGNLVAGVAHEINNPVGFLKGNIKPALANIKDLFGLLDLYQKKYPIPDPEIQDQIEAIDLEFIRQDLPKLVGSMQTGVDRIGKISISLRTFSRADTDQPVAFNLHDGIDSTLLILKHRLKANEFRPEILVIKEYGHLPQVECFAGQLNQVFMNLLANAIDALEDSNQRHSFAEIEANPNRIIIKTELSATEVKIRIQDNGMGMTEEVKQKIFEHLFTTKGVGQGTGLGLAIARQIVTEKHNGMLEVESKLGQGSEFVIVLPVKFEAIIGSNQK